MPSPGPPGVASEGGPMGEPALRRRRGRSPRANCDGRVRSVEEAS